MSRDYLKFLGLRPSPSAWDPRHKKFQTIAAFAIVLSFIFILVRSPQNYVEIDGQKIKVEVVTTLEAQNKGLSDRESLAPDAGMLFVFETPGRHSFWMKDMKFPLDIIWLDAEGQVVYIQNNASPESYPDVFDPGTDASYVLEVNDDLAEKYDLQVGDQVIVKY